MVILRDDLDWYFGRFECPTCFASELLSFPLGTIAVACRVCGARMPLDYVGEDGPLTIEDLEYDVFPLAPAPSHDYYADDPSHDRPDDVRAVLFDDEFGELLELSEGDDDPDANAPWRV